MTTVRSAPAYEFPQHLAQAVIEDWATSVVGPVYERPPLPPIIILSHVLETCYLVSLETDEGRPLTFSVCCTPETDTLRRHIKPDLVESWRFECRRELNVRELRRLAATTDLNSSAIWVTYHLQGESKPEINGLINQGSSWSSARRAFAYEYMPPPSALIIRVTGPGRISIYQGTYFIASLASGQISRNPLGILDYLGVYGFLHNGADQLRLYIEGLEQYLPTMEPQRHEPLKERLEFAWVAYLNTILGILNVIQSKKHGGALVLVEYGSHLLRRADFLKIKYRFAPNNDVLQKNFVSFIKSRNWTYDYWWKKQLESDAPAADDTLLAADSRTQDAFQSLLETVNFIGNLAGADGAIVLTNTFQTIGFSTEIATEIAANTTVYAVSDPLAQLGKEKQPLDVEQFGLRHRSAVKLCSNTNDAIVFVVSQDGDVSLVWGEGKDVMVKSGINITNAGMPAA